MLLVPLVAQNDVGLCNSETGVQTSSPSSPPVESTRVISQGYCEKGFTLKPTLEKLSVLLTDGVLE